MTPLGVLITGGAGFIGSRLARRLATDGHRVVILDSLVEQVHGDGAPDWFRAAGVEAIWADVRDEAALRGALRGVDVVHHLAAETGVGQSQYAIGRYVEVNSYGTAVLLQAAVDAGVRQVVLASSRAVYGEGMCRCPRCGTVHTGLERDPADMDAGRFEPRCPNGCGPTQAYPTSEDAAAAPTSIYGLTKLHQEQLVRATSQIYGLAPTVLRMFNVYGPGQSLRNPYTGVLGTFFRRARSGQPVELYEDGLMLRDLVFVDDVVEVFRRCTGDAGAQGKTYNVGSGQAVTLAELATTLFSAMEIEPRMDVSGRYRVGDVRHAVADTARLGRELGYLPATALDDGLAAFAAWAAVNAADAPDRFAEDELESRRLLRQAAPSSLSP
ncbi:MAG: NAD-dependent epimerase/dehydratase family protein [Acidimicrobiales bacterium]